tara:strand:+ start:204 stop:6080 length:5877 start_codon:yes stop_codon:yes gene_type:complete
MSRSICSLSVHTVDHCNDDVILNRDLFPSLKAGEYIEISDAEVGDKDNDNDGNFLILRLPSSFNDSVPRGRLEISLLKAIVEPLGLKTFSKVAVRSIAPERFWVDFVELSFRKQFLGRGNMFRTKNMLIGMPVRLGQNISVNGVNATIQEVGIQGKPVHSGIIAEDTHFIFRSRSTRIIWLVQISMEMWDVDEKGDLYFEKFLMQFVEPMMERWKEMSVTHSLSIVFFGRTILYENHESYSRDFFKNVVENVFDIEVSELLRQLKDTFWGLAEGLNWSLDQHQNERDPENMELNTATVYDGSLTIPSDASSGNFLEAINTTLNLLDKHYLDRDLHVSGNSIVMLSAGTGLFAVSPRLSQITKQRMMDLGIGMDFVSLAEPPLHTTPLFLVQASNVSRELGDFFEVPYWMNVTFVDCPLDSSATVENTVSLNSPVNKGNRGEGASSNSTNNYNNKNNTKDKSANKSDRSNDAVDERGNERGNEGREKHNHDYAHSGNNQNTFGLKARQQRAVLRQKATDELTAQGDFDTMFRAIPFNRAVRAQILLQLQTETANRPEKKDKDLIRTISVDTYKSGGSNNSKRERISSSGSGYHNCMSTMQLDWKTVLEIIPKSLKALLWARIKSKLLVSPESEHEHEHEQEYEPKHEKETNMTDAVREGEGGGTKTAPIEDEKVEEVVGEAGMKENISETELSSAHKTQPDAASKVEDPASELLQQIQSSKIRINQWGFINFDNLVNSSSRGGYGSMKLMSSNASQASSKAHMETPTNTIGSLDEATSSIAQDNDTHDHLRKVDSAITTISELGLEGTSEMGTSVDGGGMGLLTRENSSISVGGPRQQMTSEPLYKAAYAITRKKKGSLRSLNSYNSLNRSYHGHHSRNSNKMIPVNMSQSSLKSFRNLSQNQTQSGASWTQSSEIHDMHPHESNHVHINDSQNSGEVGSVELPSRMHVHSLQALRDPDTALAIEDEMAFGSVASSNHSSTSGHSHSHGQSYDSNLLVAGSNHSNHSHHNKSNGSGIDKLATSHTRIGCEKDTFMKTLRDIRSMVTKNDNSMNVDGNMDIDMTTETSNHPIGTTLTNTSKYEGLLQARFDLHDEETFRPVKNNTEISNSGDGGGEVVGIGTSLETGLMGVGGLDVSVQSQHPHVVSQSPFDVEREGSATMSSSIGNINTSTSYKGSGGGTPSRGTARTGISAGYSRRTRTNSEVSEGSRGSQEGSVSGFGSSRSSDVEWKKNISESLLVPQEKSISLLSSALVAAGKSSSTSTSDAASGVSETGTTSATGASGRESASTLGRLKSIDEEKQQKADEAHKFLDNYVQRYAVNPFKRNDPSRFLASRSHNRRRWSHVFPQGKLERDITRFFGLNWKSLTQPAILPINTDYMPPANTLNSSNYQWREYEIVVDPQEWDDSPFDSPYSLLFEMVCQRLTQEFQLVQGMDLREYTRQISAFSRQSLKNSSQIFRTESAVTLASSSSANSFDPPEDTPISNHTSSPTPITPLSNFNSSDRHRTANRHNNDSPAEPTTYILSMGHRIQILTYVPNDNKFKVFMYTSGKGNNNTPEAQAEYTYDVWVPQMNKFQSQTQRFYRYPHPEVNWNTIDHVLYTNDKSLIRDSLKLKRIRFALMPDIAATTSKDGQVAYFAKIDLLTAFLTNYCRDDKIEVKKVYGLLNVESIEEEMNQTQHGQHEQKQQRQQQQQQDTSHKAVATRDVILWVAQPNTDDPKWIYLTYDTLVHSDRVFHLTFQWVKCDSWNVDELTNHVFRRCTNWGLRLAQIPEYFCESNLAIHPFRAQPWIPVDQLDANLTTNLGYETATIVVERLFFADVKRSQHWCRDKYQKTDWTFLGDEYKEGAGEIPINASWNNSNAEQPININRRAGIRSVHIPKQLPRNAQYMLRACLASVRVGRKGFVWLMNSTTRVSDVPLSNDEKKVTVNKNFEDLKQSTQSIGICYSLTVEIIENSIYS